MDRRTKLSILAIGLLLSSLLLAYISFQASVDPVAQFRAADGSLRIPGGQFTPDLQRLLFPAPAPKDYTVYRSVQSGYPTTEIRGYTYDLPSPVEKTALKPVGTDSFKVFFNALLSLPKNIVSFFESISPFGTAAAVNRFAVFDDVACTATLVITDADCWSTTTNGAGNGLPVAGDDLVFDNGSGAVSGTMNASLSVTTGTIVFCSGAAAPDADCGGAWANTLTIVTFTLTNTGTFFANGGTISISTGGIDSGAFTLNGSTLSISGAAAMVHDGLTITSGTYAKAAAALTVQGALTMSGGDLTSTSGAVSVTGAVSISSVASAIDFGSETWTVTGTWTNASTDAAWDAGTGTVTFDSATGGTMTFAGVNLAEAEFNNVTFTSSAGTAQTFTMATRGLRWLAALTVSDTVLTTDLASADLALGDAADAADVVVGNGGILTANASTVLVNGVTMTGGTSGTITVTTGVWTVSGSWNTSGASSIYTQGTGIVTFDAAATITLLSTDNTFDDLTISAATSTLGSAVVVTNALTISGGTFAKSTFAITSAGSLTMSGGDLTSTSGAAVITGAVNISSALSAIDFGSETWTVSGTWTNASTDAAWDAGTGTVVFNAGADGTMTFAGVNLAEDEFNHATFNSTLDGVDYTMATRNLRVGGTITVTDTATTVSLVVGTLDLIFDHLVVTTNGTMSMNSIAVVGTDIDTSAGSITLTSWTNYESGTNASIVWVMDPSVAGATVTMVFTGMTTGVNYRLLRDGSSLGTTAPSGGAVTFAITAGWSSHTMTVDLESGGGGNGGLPTQPPGIVLPTLAQMATGIGIVALGVLAVIGLIHLLHFTKGTIYKSLWVVFAITAILWFWLTYGMK